jgi:catechol 2,3-dioxygenase-like lactoylglutathione lyase family enzyme
MSELIQTYLMTADLERSRRFYESGVGLTPSTKGDSSVAYETGGCELKLQADFDETTLASFNLSPPGENRGDGAILVVTTDGPLADVHDRIEALDDDVGTAVTEPRDVPWGDRMFLARDPNGYVCELRAGDGTDPG